MLGKLKNILGIEGVKINLLLDDPIMRSEEAIFGDIVLSSLSSQVIQSIELKFIERYHRGRKENKLIDEYELGAMIISDTYHIVKGEEIKIPFTLPYVHVQSEMDKIADTNFISKGIVFVAKSLKGVKSEYRLIAKAKIKGTTLDPIVKKMVILE